MNNNQTDTKVRKRGRPRKNFTDIKPKEKKKIVDLSTKREIVLHLPISMNSKNNKSVDNSSNTKNTEMTISDDYSSISDTEDSEDIDVNTKELLRLLNNKEKIIKGLKKELSMYKQNDSIINTKEIKQYPMDIEFIDNKTGEMIIVNKTDIACWWCTYQFDNIPCFIPERYDNNRYHVFGCFCSFNCAVAYNLNMNDYKIYDRYSLIKKLYQYLYKKDDDIYTSPQKEVLKKYGGHLTIKEYRKNLKFNKKEYKVLMPPMVSIVPVIQEKERSIINKNDTNRYERKDNNLTILDHLNI